MRRKGRFVQFAISSPSHYYRLVKMYINTLNIWTTYDKFNSVSNINNEDIKWVCRVINNIYTHTHTELSDKENEEIEQLVFEQVFYEDSFKRGSRISSSQSLYLLI